MNTSTVVDQDRSRVFSEGDLSSNIFTFSESCGASSSNLVDFSTRVAWSARTPKTASSTKSWPSNNSTAHRPWENAVPCEPRWFNDPCSGLCMEPGPNRRPRTFKPILLYHRPEEHVQYSRQLPRYRPLSSCGGYSICSAKGGTCCFLENCQSEETDIRDLLSCAASSDHFRRICVNDFRNNNCDCNFVLRNSLAPRTCGCGLRQMEVESDLCPTLNGKVGRQAAGAFEQLCRGSYTWSDDSNSINSEIPFSVMPLSHNPFTPHPHNHLMSKSQVPYPTTLQNPFPTIPVICTSSSQAAFPMRSETPFAMTAPQLSKPYISAFARYPKTLGHGSVNEIRRALLLNHPVFSESCTEVYDCCHDKIVTGSHDVSGKQVSANKNSESEKRKEEISSSRDPNVKYMRHQNGQSVSSKSVNSSAAVKTTTFPGQIQPLENQLLGQILSPNASASPIISPSFPAAGVDGWQECPEKSYGSFLQLLNSPDYPPSVSGGKPVTLSSLVSDSADKQIPHTSLSYSLLHTEPNGELSDQTDLHTAPLGELVLDDAEERESRKHRCPYCDVACTNSGQLKGHLRVHTGERPYSCECGRAFARNEELTRHRRIHSGQRPHQCNICGKKFGRKDHLNKHQKTHLHTSEKKTHACEVSGCRQRYTRSDALARHQWGAHGIKAKNSRIRPTLASDEGQITGADGEEQDLDLNHQIDSNSSLPSPPLPSQ